MTKKRINVPFYEEHGARTLRAKRLPRVNFIELKKFGWMQATLMNINTEVSNTYLTVLEKPCRHLKKEHQLYIQVCLNDDVATQFCLLCLFEL